MAVRLVLAKHGYHKGIPLRLPFPFDIVIIAAPGNPKDLTHNSYRIFCLVTVDNLISILRPHIPVSYTHLDVYKRQGLGFAVLTGIAKVGHNSRDAGGGRALHGVDHNQ